MDTGLNALTGKDSRNKTIERLRTKIKDEIFKLNRS